MSAAGLLRCRQGGSAVEFAIAAPVFLALLLGLMEYARLIWTVQSLNSVAFSTARCATYGSSCGTSSAAASYATQLASGFGLTVTAANVTFTGNTTCNGNSGQNKVTVAYAFNSPIAGFIPAFPATVTGTGCFFK